ncbi:hypothetical protein E4O05_01090 [Treponema sp. OMZ 787]|uniref:hypothetical protein n=1 Tax=Treponema sp. OMZ 787 TaxID=2563669 RepID=UPI0020A3DB90|nr:hypothetical protein [Treponema sp. OMZ 787]UTC62540.1 hypothetical protein E4O05_01090 [Treponema sp. OMZ 787]
MIKYSFQNRTYKLIAFFFLFTCFSFFCFAQENSVQSLDSGKAKIFNLDECGSLFAEYYRSNTISDEDLKTLIDGINHLTDSLDKILVEDKKMRDIKKQNELLILYLEYAEILSTIYNYGGMNHQGKVIKKIDKNLKRFLKLSNLEGEVYLKYADYLYTKLPLPETKRFNTILTLPVLYRRALLKDKNNKTAFVKLSCWQIAAADETTSNFNSQIKSTEEYIEELNDVDKFNAYIWYSIFYMKIYDTKKGWEHFYKAKNIFPNHPIVSLLHENYKKGILGGL